MTATLRRPDPKQLNRHRPQPLQPKLPAPPGGLRRNRPRIAVGLAISAVCIIGVVAVVARGADRQQVLTLAQDLAAGSTIGAEDVVAVELPASSPLPMILAKEQRDIIGQSIAVSLPKGTLLNRSLLTNEARVPGGMALVGVVLDPGQYPTDLSIGDTVELVQTAPLAAGPAATVTNLGTGEVRQVKKPATGGKALVVSLLVPKANADAIAAAGAQGRISLVVVGSR